MQSWSPSASISTLITLSTLSKKKPSGSHETIPLELIAEARSKGYNSVCLPLTTEDWHKRWTEMCLVPSDSVQKRTRESRRESKLVNRDLTSERKAEAWRENPCFERDEVTITKLDEAENVTAIISEWLELDAEEDGIRYDAEIALQQELAYASYLNIHTAILPAPRNRDHISSYARTVKACLSSAPYMNLAIRLPVYDTSILEPTIALSPSGSPSSFKTPSAPSTPRLVVSGSDTTLIKLSPSAAPLEAHIDAAWETWDLIRSICDYNIRLTLALDLTPPLPNSPGVLSKWAAEAVRYIFLPSSTFIANAKGYPVLPKPTQTFIRDSMVHRPNIIISGASSGLHKRGGEDAYSQYVKHLERTSPVVQAAEKVGTVENFAQGYQDYLQAPLQPLMDNLQSITYQTFEQDPVKYQSYELAIHKALVEWPKQETIVICVAGAGRGPLVARSLSAIKQSKKENVCLYAIEKNPNAFVTLQNRQRTEWEDRVRLLFGDMRVIEMPEKVDILVSELLGSFGDNELSPECLDGAMRFLKPQGISIPSSYTAHLAPLSSSKLYNEARAIKEEKGLETPYVVMFQAVNLLSGEGPGISGLCGPQVQECWEFEHPRKNPVLNGRGLPPTNSHNTRSAKLRFHIPHAGVLHGLAGYFEAILYGNIGLSIHPQRKDQISKDMLSWFPLFFPFKEPLYLPSNSELQVTIWRLTNERQVWYEWHAEAFLGFVSTPFAGTTSPTTSGQPLPPVNLMTSPTIGVPSPLIDAVDLLPRSSISVHDTPERTTARLVKIGHTSLHNPGGRSSWIGL
ncbi:shk1 kinase-binding protein 1 [Lentinula raphanica]|uniref:Shk1 kinase-binding protein 1 n=1 Tax=Lentinula raphanica TaxID=153919 RepID=A0AA38P963_9AGAR|nr:shk1 kinase-binding protein 1 [Lentinula raphanica]KAJ3838393.1 shk1 kinase-binding protein 1 [Lentinula raphanica]